MPHQGRIVICATGFKGIRFVEAHIARGQRIDCIVSYVDGTKTAGEFERLRLLAQVHKIDWIESKYPVPRPEDMTILVGWQFLLSNITPTTVVFHDSLLPRYRGFTPTVTALIRGETEIGVSAILPVGDVDAGPILAQRSQVIHYPVKIEAALRRQAELMADIAAEIVQRWRDDALVAYAQNENAASFSVWRDDADYEIDWAHDAASIERFVDALGTPYDCARTSVGNETIRVTDVTALPDLQFEIRHVGKIWRIEDGCPVIVCGAGLIRINACHCENGAKFEFKRVRMRVGGSAYK